MRDGIIIKEHQRWNTKQVWVRGYLMMQYRRVPKALRFASPMVNDTNQDLCGGWSRPEHDARGEGAIIVDRVLAGLKPLGDAHFPSRAAAEPHLARIAAAGLPHAVREVTHMRRPGDTGECPVAVEVCQRGTLGGLFDLDALVDAYGSNVVPPLLAYTVSEQSLKVADRTLESFFGRWDVPRVWPWVTGLVLGYPVENTIALGYARAR